jgi:hypothetical protein
VSAEAASAVREGLALFALCWLLARTEIEIEGPHGWAVTLPTWRWGPEWFLNLTNGKAVTGYHVWLTVLLVAFFHLPLVFAGFSRELWAKGVSSYLILTSAWDLQWFAWNPAWGIARFRREHVPWFRRTLLDFPVDYYLAVLASAAATALIWRPGLAAWAIRTGTLLAASLVSVLAAGAMRASAAQGAAEPQTATSKRAAR